MDFPWIMEQSLADFLPSSIRTACIEALVEERENRGLYLSLKDFIQRLTGVVNKRAIENFIKAGAVDCLEGNRRQKMTVYAQIVDSIAQDKKNTVAGQMSLFDFAEEDVKKDFDIRMPDVGRMIKVPVSYEEVLGIYLSGHPLERYSSMME